ncbi:MAG: hypothetical protein II951_08225 [Bacteroidales bacterium]|nr:hypothetical protein [Bacteroidales bacterium]
MRKKLLTMFVLLGAVVTGTVAQTYKVSLKDGTEDADKWEITPAEATTTGVAEKTAITATYSGDKMVKGVKAVKKASGTTTVIPVVDSGTKGDISYTLDDEGTLTISGTGAVPEGAFASYYWRLFGSSEEDRLCR